VASFSATAVTVTAMSAVEVAGPEGAFLPVGARVRRWHVQWCKFAPDRLSGAWSHVRPTGERGRGSPSGPALSVPGGLKGYAGRTARLDGLLFFRRPVGSPVKHLLYSHVL